MLHGYGFIPKADRGLYVSGFLFLIYACLYMAPIIPVLPLLISGLLKLLFGIEDPSLAYNIGSVPILLLLAIYAAFAYRHIRYKPHFLFVDPYQKKLYVIKAFSYEVYDCKGFKVFCKRNMTRMQRLKLLSLTDQGSDFATLDQEDKENLLIAVRAAGGRIQCGDCKKCDLDHGLPPPQDR